MIIYASANKFYITFPITGHGSDKVVSELKKGVLLGVIGISKTHKILLDFMGSSYRDGALIMGEAELKKANPSLKQFGYSPKDLMADDMWGLYRLYGSTTRHQGLMGDRQVVNNLVDNVIKKGRTTARSMLPPIFRNKWSKGEYGIGRLLSNFFKTNKLNTPEDLAYALDDSTRMALDENNEDMSLSLWKKIAIIILKEVGSTYSSEEEWITPNKLNIPKDSRLLLVASNSEEQNKLLKKVNSGEKLSERETKRVQKLKVLHSIKDELDGRYKITFVSDNKFAEARLKYMQASLNGITSTRSHSSSWLLLPKGNPDLQLNFLEKEKEKRISKDVVCYFIKGLSRRYVKLDENSEPETAVLFLTRVEDKSTGIAVDAYSTDDAKGNGNIPMLLKLAQRYFKSIENFSTFSNVTWAKLVDPTE